MQVDQSRWSQQRARAWQSEKGWLVGCNFTPSTAGNQLEMWQAETFDPDRIALELGWASDLGMNAIRVYLHDLLYADDAPGFFSRMDQVLAIAHEANIGMIPVLFDGVWHPRPKLGPQPEPKPFLHNSIWVQSPGATILHDPERWPELAPYVQETLTRYKDDERILAWDLFNEPDQMDATTRAADSRVDKSRFSTDLLNHVFDWARAVDPSQPLTAGLWEYDEAHAPMANEVNNLMLARSDIVSFHCYEPGPALSSVIDHLRAHERPLLCTEWLARTAGSTVDLLRVFKDTGVGAINWGLVDGRTQTRFPWKSWTEKVDEDEPWFHEIFHADGSPYDQAEADLFKRLTAG